MNFKRIFAAILASTMLFSATIIANAQAEDYVAPKTGFVSDSQLSMDLVGHYSSGEVNFDGGVMEIISYNYSNGYAYAVNGVSGNIAIIKISDLTGTDYTTLKAVEFDVKTAVTAKDSTFAYGDMTSISVSEDGSKLAVALQAEDFDKVGRAAIFSCKADGSLDLTDVITVGVQPDMIKFVDSNTVLTADEAEPDVVDGKYVDPKGSVSIVDLTTKTATVLGFEKFDNAEIRQELINQGAMFKSGANASTDFEPEYITVVGDKAYVSLQEANSIAVVAIKSKEISNVFGLGFIDLGKVAFDINDNDEVYAPELHPGVYSVRMPDAIDSYEVDGTTYIVTANEGDGREYGDEDEDAEAYCNEVKVKFSKGENSPNGNMTADVYGEEGKDYGKVLFINTDTVDVINGDTADYMYGGRGFTIFKVTDSGLEVAFEVGSDVEENVAKYLPKEYFNCSNDNNFTEDRSGKKGSEAESVVVGEVNGEVYAFLALERVSGIMAYNISNPNSGKFVNYINTRDFDNIVGDPAWENGEDVEGVCEYDDGELDKFVTFGDVAPEGLAFISAENSPNGYPMLLTSNEVSGTVAAFKLGNTKYEKPAPKSEEIVILHTNDTHCDIENGFGFAGVAAYLKDMEESFGKENVTLVDAGDAVQGDAVGKLTQGEAIIKLMNSVGYDIFTLGNHEFDYKVLQMFKLMDMFEGKVVSSNFMDLTLNKSVFDAYTIEDYGTFQVAYVGITTPETYTKSTPAYFQDKDGNYIYGFCEGDNGENLYKNVQDSVDLAIKDGADYVVAVTHLGVDETSAPYRSSDLIANTTGIDVLIDGHSHSTVQGKEVENKNGEMVIVNQTGEKFDNLGKITINNETGTITAELISADTYTEKDEDVQNAVNAINEENKGLLEQVIAQTNVDLYAYNPQTGDRLIRSQETNLGDFCADAYRFVLETDIAIVNGGGIRADILSGDVTYADVIAVHPWGNNATSILASGQDILDALELGASANPTESGGFLQVSGITYKIDPSVKSTVVVDEKGSFVKVDGDYRVYDVMVGDKPIDLKKMYSVGSHDYMLLDGGDGMTMFEGCEVVKSMYMVDNEVLMTYMQEVENLDDYKDINGQGRIVIEEEVQTDENVPQTGEKETMIFVVVCAAIVLTVYFVRKKGEV